MNDLKNSLERIRDELRAIVDGAETNDDGEQKTLWDYFYDALDVEYTLSWNDVFLGARIYVTLGGPTVWIDTRAGLIYGAWGRDRASIVLPADITNELNQIVCEYRTASCG
jgi:hypothetical protein